MEPLGQPLGPWGVLLSGLVVGAVCGFTTRRAGLCSFAAVEDAWMGGDTRRLRVFGLALAIAVVGTQAMVAAGLIVPAHSNYVPAMLPAAAILLGATLFGIGMALVGTCGYGALVRLGGGDLRGLVVALVFGAVAFATLRGVLAPLRIDVLEQWALPMPAGVPADLPSLLAALGLGDWRMPATLAGAAALVVAVAIDARLRRARRLLVAAVALGLGVLAGWFVTGIAADPFAGPVRPQSLTFVAPVGRALYATLATPAALFDFGVASVFGVVAGALASALCDASFRWEAFDDHHEMRRHLAGAVLMGFGGILAGGCTIGQGLTAGSMAALSWPLAIAGMMLGARLGIWLLIEGSLGQLLRWRQD